IVRGGEIGEDFNAGVAEDRRGGRGGTEQAEISSEATDLSARKARQWACVAQSIHLSEPQRPLRLSSATSALKSLRWRPQNRIERAGGEFARRNAVEPGLLVKAAGPGIDGADAH